MSDENKLSPDAKLTTGFTVAFVLNGRQQYAKVEITESRLRGESFDDFSARVNAAAITHMSNAVDELAAQFKEITA